MINIESIDGFLYFSEYQAMKQYAQETYRKKCDTLDILEIGSYKGKSTVAWLQACSSRIVAIEPFCGPPEVPELTGVSTEQDFLNNTKQYCDQIRLIKKYSNNPSIHDDLLNQTFDIVFIDGDHSYEAVVNDIKLALQYVIKNGLIVLHDYWINAASNFKFKGLSNAVHEYLMYKRRFLSLHRSLIVFENNINFKTYER
jgi:predicted O-methyltransferase YrrM